MAELKVLNVIPGQIRSGRFFPAARKPVSRITDRAKRYRANVDGFRPQNPRQCGFCGSKRNVEVNHISGNESDGDPTNLMWGCRRCNTKIAHVMKKAYIGKRTRQYNPKPSGKSEMAEYGTAIKIMRGDFPGDVSKAVATIRATPAAVRSAYTRKTWPTRRQLYGHSGRQTEIPF
jgi:hypothetical protein